MCPQKALIISGMAWLCQLFAGLAMVTLDDEHWMGRAILLAREAARVGEVPVGCVIVFHGREVGSGFNLRERGQDPTAHAEMVALRHAARSLGSWRLEGCSCYVTLEPCPMCAGALVNARVARVVFGAEDPKAGAVTSLYRVGTSRALNHRFDVVRGVRSAECGALLSTFFRSVRKRRSL